MPTPLRPFQEANVYDNTVTGVEGRNPQDWGTPNDPSHGVLGSGDTPTPADSFTMAPGDEFAFGNFDESGLDEGQFGYVLDTTPYLPDGYGTSVGVPMVGLFGPADPRRIEYEAEVVTVHQDDRGGPLRARHVNPLAQGTENVAAWQMRATNRGATIGGPYNDAGQLVSSPGSDRPALDFTTHNRAKMLKRPIIDYGERPWTNNIAAVAARSEPPRSILSPSNNHNPAFMGVNPGPGVVYQAPPDPQIVAQSVSPGPADDYGFMSYGGA